MTAADTAPRHPRPGGPAGCDRARRRVGRRATKAAPRPPRSSTRVGATAAPTVVERELNPDELAALEEQRAFLLTSLRDLEAEHDAGDVDDADYDALEDDYTARAAAVIRAIDGHHAPRRGRARRMSWSRRLVVIGAVALVAILAGVFVARSAGQRNAGDTITGGVRQSTRDQLLAARQKLGSRTTTAPSRSTTRSWPTIPANVEALTYRGWMYRLKAITEASTSDPVPSLTSAIHDLKAALDIPARRRHRARVPRRALRRPRPSGRQALDTLAKVAARRGVRRSWHPRSTRSASRCRPSWPPARRRPRPPASARPRVSCSDR